MNTDKLTEELNQQKIIPGSDEDLSVELIARFSINQGAKDSIKKIRKENFVDGALWMRSRLSIPKETDAVEWIRVDNNLMPLETTILISHKFGIDAIHFQQAYWRYLYSGTIVDSTTLSMVTHFAVPKSPKP